MIIGKTFTFEAAHQLPDEECYGACRNLHGHTYKLIVEIEGKIDVFGWVMNFKDLKKIVNEKVINKFDHQFLNDHFIIPTAEVMVKRIFEDISNSLPINTKLYCITLYETQNSFVKFFGENNGRF